VPLSPPSRAPYIGEGWKNQGHEVSPVVTSITTTRRHVPVLTFTFALLDTVISRARNLKKDMVELFLRIIDPGLAVLDGVREQDTEADAFRGSNEHNPDRGRLTRTGGSLAAPAPSMKTAESEASLSRILHTEYYMVNPSRV
jgi:hypothetical protein